MSSDSCTQFMKMHGFVMRNLPHDYGSGKSETTFGNDKRFQEKPYTDPYFDLPFKSDLYSLSRSDCVDQSLFDYINWTEDRNMYRLGGASSTNADEVNWPPNDAGIGGPKEEWQAIANRDAPTNGQNNDDGPGINLFRRAFSDWTAANGDRNISGHFVPEKTYIAAGGEPVCGPITKNNGGNPYQCLSAAIAAANAPGIKQYGYACRVTSPRGKYCSEEAGSFTINRRAAAWGCGIGSMIGLSTVGVCNPDYDYDGLKDYIDQIGRVLPQFQSLAFMCLSENISAFQCKMVQNFATQDALTTAILAENEKLVSDRLKHPMLIDSIALALILMIIVFISVIKVFRY